MTQLGPIWLDADSIKILFSSKHGHPIQASADKIAGLVALGLIIYVGGSKPYWVISQFGEEILEAQLS